MTSFRIALVLGLLLASVAGGCSDSGSSGDGQRAPESPGQEGPMEGEDPPEDSGGSEQPPEETPPDATGVRLSVADATVHEDGGPLTFVVRAEGTGEAQDTLVDFRTVDGSAVAGEDYIAAAGTLRFVESVTEQAVAIEIIDDDAPEGTETFSLRLENPLGAELARESARGTILDDEADVCGPPEIDEDGDTAAFLWKDCPDGSWHLAVTAAGGALEYAGAVTAGEPFIELTPVNLEADDAVAAASARRIRFSLAVAGDADGFDFAVPQDAGVCFQLESPADTPVLVGRNRNPVTTPFDLATLEACEPDQPESDRPYNVVVVYTDDQRFDTLEMTIDGTDVMPNVKQRLLPMGVMFENAYTPIPLCCPARASTYSGGFLAQDTGVLDNVPPNGGMAAFNDRGNIGVRMQQAGYRTMFVGKWLNDYPNFTPYVPPGWDAFVGRASWANGAGWFNFQYVFGSTRESSGTGEERGSDGQYHPYFERDRIIEFIEETPDDQPYLVFWSTTPPHLPAVADVPDRELFADFRYRGRGYREEDLSDKPQWVKHPGRPIGDDEEVRVQVQSLHSLDRAIGGLLDTLAARGDLDETVIIVTSDNGYMWGEHGVWNKKMPYEESIRVPLLVVMPGIEPRRDEHLVSAILDLGPTLYDIAGTSGPTQGRSLLPLLKDPSVDWRDSLFAEHYGVRRSALENWAAIRQGRWKYVEYWYGEKELYDLEGDPFELENRAGDPAVEQVESSLRQRLRDQLGLAIHPIWRDTGGRVGERYRLEVPTWGGEPPFEWTVDSGQLPPGLRLNGATGEITGTPSRAGTWTFRLRVASSAPAVQAGRPQTFVSAELTITIE